ncbi:uncharacterized protein LOC127869173 isoform X2 [Dreissena polymorpha]|uniref:uncharacterized protein LOC127869173 isoform X2 n=1 Tax=Dreissena polymorpha TaxID=45954 RepID=UPI002263C3E1|nr:uncharacterized protein LOC127869173 isoform X2 [Dreissena polymorpha]
MANKEETSVLQKGSDLLIDYFCSVCEDNDNLIEAQSYCESCSKWYCDQCVSLHDQMYKKHTTLGMSAKAKWPVANVVAELLSQCEEHKGKTIKMFCAEHGQLCCTRYCNKVTQITSEEHKQKHDDLQKLSADVTYLTQRLLKLIEHKECNIQSLQCSFDEVLEEIALMRMKFNSALDSLEQRTINEGIALVSRLKESLQADIDSGKKALNKIQSFKEAADKIGLHESELSTIAFMKIQKELSLSDLFLRMATVTSYSNLSFEPNKEIENCLATMTSLGYILSYKSNAIITATQQSLYNVKLSGESSCEIRCICEMSNGNILLADSKNNKVKMLDKEFRVISHCDMPSDPRYICQVSDTEVAVSVYDLEIVHEIHFLSVTDNTLVKKKSLNLTHPCTGIHHYNGQLFVTSRTALYRYSMTGTLLDKLYEDNSAVDTVCRCAVNTDGEMIYVVNYSHQKVLTLNMKGQLLASFTDPDLQSPIDLHLSTSGQVLVCATNSKNIIQLNSEGTEKIASVAALKEGKSVLSICMLRRTGYVLVGRSETDVITVFDTKRMHINYQSE